MSYPSSTSKPDRLGGDSNAGPPLQLNVPDGVPEYEVQELHKFKMRCVWPHALVRWTGLDGRVTRGSRSIT